MEPTMAKARKKSEVHEETPSEGPDIFDEQIAARQAEGSADIHPLAQATEISPAPTDHQSRQQTSAGEGYAATLEKKKYTPPADPFGFENIRAGSNRVRLLKSEGERAWVIRFAHNPNEDKGANGETYSKETPHPVLKMLKDEGYRWGFDGGDGKGGWGKAFTADPYGAEHIEARRVLQKAADMVGQPKERERLPD
jgi:hypothetical protein